MTSIPLTCRLIAALLVAIAPLRSFGSEPEFSNADREEFLKYLDDTVAKAMQAAQIKLPITRDSLRMDAERAFIGGTIATAFARAADTKASASTTPQAISLRVLGPPPWHTKIQHGLKPAEPGELREEEARIFFRVKTLGEYAPEFKRRYVAPDVGFTVNTETNPATLAMWSHALQSFGMFSASNGPNGPTGSVSTMKKKLIDALNQLPQGLRSDVEFSTIAEVTNKSSGGFVVVTQPVASQNDEWYFQRYLTIVVSPDRPDALSSGPIASFDSNATSSLTNWTIDVSYTLRRRKGAQDFSAIPALTGQSGEAEQRLLTFLLEHMKESKHF